MGLVQITILIFNLGHLAGQIHFNDFNDKYEQSYRHVIELITVFDGVS